MSLIKSGSMRIPKTLALLAWLLLVTTLITSCSKKYTFSQSPVSPAAEGTVKVKSDNNRNYRIRIKVMNLARSRSLPDPKDHYVVWMESDDHRTRNLGQLRSSKRFLGNNLRASLETVTTFKPSRVFVTAEDDATINYPKGITVLSTSSW